jgi:hypothetical protein
MATRFYLSSTGTAPSSPAFDSTWTITTGATRLSMDVTKDGSVMTSKASASAGVSVNALIVQHVSPALAAQTILNTGTFRIQQRRLASVTGNNFPLWVIYVVSPTGTVRGYITNGYNSTATTTSLVNRGTNNSAQTISVWQNTPGNISVTAGDFLVLEQGGQSQSGSKTQTASIGSDNATDLPENLTTTTANNPWFELSQTLIFQGGGLVNTGIPLWIF